MRSFRAIDRSAQVNPGRIKITSLRICWRTFLFYNASLLNEFYDIGFSSTVEKYDVINSRLLVYRKQTATLTSYQGSRGNNSSTDMYIKNVDLA